MHFEVDQYSKVSDLDEPRVVALMDMRILRAQRERNQWAQRMRLPSEPKRGGFYEHKGSLIQHDQKRLLKQTLKRQHRDYKSCSPRVHQSSGPLVKSIDGPNRFQMGCPKEVVHKVLPVNYKSGE